MKDGKNETDRRRPQPRANTRGYMLSPLRGWFSHCFIQLIKRISIHWPPEVWRLRLRQKYRFSTVYVFNGDVFDQNSPTLFVNDNSHLSLAFAILDLTNHFAAHPERCQHQNQQPCPAWIRPQSNAFDFCFRLGEF